MISKWGKELNLWKGLGGTLKLFKLIKDNVYKTLIKFLEDLGKVIQYFLFFNFFHLKIPPLSHSSSLVGISADLI